MPRLFGEIQLPEENTCSTGWSVFFAPDHFVDDADVGLDDLDDLVGDVDVCVVRDGDGSAVLFFPDHFDGCVDGLEEAFCVDAGEDEAGFVQSFRALGGGADANGRDGVSDGGKEGGLLGEGAGIGDDAEGVHLQAVVVMEAEGLVLDHAGVELEAGGLEALSGAGMAGVEDGHVVLFRHLIDCRKE